MPKPNPRRDLEIKPLSAIQEISTLAPTRFKALTNLTNDFIKNNPDACAQTPRQWVRSEWRGLAADFVVDFGDIWSADRENIKQEGKDDPADQPEASVDTPANGDDADVPATPSNASTTSKDPATPATPATDKKKGRGKKKRDSEFPMIPPDDALIYPADQDAITFVVFALLKFQCSKYFSAAAIAKRKEAAREEGESEDEMEDEAAKKKAEKPKKGRKPRPVKEPTHAPEYADTSQVTEEQARGKKKARQPSRPSTPKPPSKPAKPVRGTDWEVEDPAQAKSDDDEPKPFSSERIVPRFEEPPKKEPRRQRPEFAPESQKLTYNVPGRTDEAPETKDPKERKKRESKKKAQVEKPQAEEANENTETVDEPAEDLVETAQVNDHAAVDDHGHEDDSSNEVEMADEASASADRHDDHEDTSMLDAPSSPQPTSPATSTTASSSAVKAFAKGDLDPANTGNKTVARPRAEVTPPPSNSSAAASPKPAPSQPRKGRNFNLTLYATVAVPVESSSEDEEEAETNEPGSKRKRHTTHKKRSRKPPPKILVPLDGGFQSWPAMWAEVLDAVPDNQKSAFRNAKRLILEVMKKSGEIDEVSISTGLKEAIKNKLFGKTLGAHIGVCVDRAKKGEEVEGFTLGDGGDEPDEVELNVRFE